MTKAKTPTNTTASKTPKKKDPIIPVTLEIKLPNEDVRAILSEACAHVEDMLDLENSPLKLDDLVRNRAVIAVLTKAVSREVHFLCSSLVDEDDVLDDVAEAIRELYREELDAASVKQQEVLNDLPSTILVKRSKIVEARELLRKHGLL